MQCFTWPFLPQLFTLRIRRALIVRVFLYAPTYPRGPPFTLPQFSRGLISARAAYLRLRKSSSPASSKTHAFRPQYTTSREGCLAARLVLVMYNPLGWTCTPHRREYLFLMQSAAERLAPIQWLSQGAQAYAEGKNKFIGSDLAMLHCSVSSIVRIFSMSHCRAFWSCHLVAT